LIIDFLELLVDLPQRVNGIAKLLRRWLISLLELRRMKENPAKETYASGLPDTNLWDVEYVRHHSVPEQHNDSAAYYDAQSDADEMGLQFVGPECRKRFGEFAFAE
jgi:hypothetical protein